MTCRLGFLGAGTIAAEHAAAAARAGSVVSAVCDRDEPRAQALAAKHPGAVATADAAALLARDDVDAVVIAVPNALHRDFAIQSLEAGKDVLLEKPMAMNLRECDEILAVLENSDRLLQLGFVTRCSPVVERLVRMIEAGRFGRIYHARAQWIRRRGIPGLGGWFTTRDVAGGGVLIDLGVHLIDVVMHLAGRPAARRVSGVCTSLFGAPIERYAYTEMWAGPPRPEGTFDVEDAATALIRFDGDLALELSVSWAANVAEEDAPGGVYLLGERGGCFFNAWTGTIRIATEQDGELVDLIPRLPPGDAWEAAWTRQHERFRASVEQRTPPDASARDGRAVQAILDAIYRSSAEGREVGV